MDLIIALGYIFYRLSKFNEVDKAGNIIYIAKPWPFEKSI